MKPERNHARESVSSGVRHSNRDARLEQLLRERIAQHLHDILALHTTVSSSGFRDHGGQFRKYVLPAEPDVFGDTSSNSSESKPPTSVPPWSTKASLVRCVARMPQPRRDDSFQRTAAHTACQDGAYRLVGV